MWAATRKIMSAIIILIFSGCFSRSESKMFSVLNNSKMNSLWMRSSVHPKPITVCFSKLAFSIVSKFDSRKRMSVNDVIEIDSVHSFESTLIVTILILSAKMCFFHDLFFLLKFCVRAQNKVKPQKPFTESALWIEKLKPI